MKFETSDQALHYCDKLKARQGVKHRPEPGKHYGSKQGDNETLNYTLSHELGSEQSERVSKRMSAAECTSKASK